MMGPNAGAVTDAKRKELGLDKEAAVQAGLLDGKGIIRYRDVQGQALVDAVEELICETKL